MKPSRKLDALVHERVMGGHVVAYDWPCGYDPECGHYEADLRAGPDPATGAEDSWHPDRGPIHAPIPGGWPPNEAGIALVEPVPFYSSEWEAVEDVVLRVIEEGGDWCITSSPSQEPRSMWVAGAHFGTRCDRRSFIACAETFELAVCLAALKAKGVDAEAELRKEAGDASAD